MNTGRVGLNKAKIKVEIHKPDHTGKTRLLPNPNWHCNLVNTGQDTFKWETFLDLTLHRKKSLIERCMKMLWHKANSWGTGWQMYWEKHHKSVRSGIGSLCSWRCYLVVIAHEGTPGVLGPQEAVDQHGPAQREVEADVLLKVTAELVTGQVITEAEALTRNQLVHLLSDWAGKQRLKTLCTQTWIANILNVCGLIKRYSTYYSRQV